jgi:N-acyl-L-homoserine lactone synthetase
MYSQVRLAQTEEEVDAVFRGRYRVFVETHKYIEPNDENRLYDRYDSYPTTANFIAVHDGELIGGLRFTERSPVGSSPEETFNFGMHLPPASELYGSGSWLFLDSAYRKRSSITYCLWTLAYAWAQERRWSKLFCVANPVVVPSLLQHGFRQLAAVRIDARKNLPYVPVMRDLRELDQSMQALISTLHRRGRLHHNDVELMLPRRPQPRHAYRRSVSGRAAPKLDSASE